MARGEPGAPPFNRRVLMPALARRVGFGRVAATGLAGQVVVAGWQAARVARELGAPPPVARRAGLLAAGLVPAAPHGARLARQVPAFNDGLAAALGGAWLLLAWPEEPDGGPRRAPAWGLSARAARLRPGGPRRPPARGLSARAVLLRPGGPRRPPMRGLSARAALLRPRGLRSLSAPAALALAALTREQWLVVAALLRPGRAHLPAGALAGAVVASRPAAPGGEVYPPRVALRRFVTRDGLAELGWGLAFVLGALPVLVPAALRARRRSPALDAALRTAGVQGALALVGGSDTPRLLHGALLPLLPALTGAAAATGDRRLPAVLAATVAAWRPGESFAPTLEAYERFFLPYMQGELARRTRADLLRRTGACAATLALSSAWRAPGRPT
jgi:hypothetical protein